MGHQKKKIASIIERIESEPRFLMATRSHEGSNLKQSLNDFSTVAMELFRAGTLRAQATV